MYDSTSVGWCFLRCNPAPCAQLTYRMVLHIQLYRVLHGTVGLRHENQCSRTREKHQELKLLPSWQPPRDLQNPRICHHKKSDSANNLHDAGRRVSPRTCQHLGFGPGRLSAEKQLGRAGLQLPTYQNRKIPNLCWWKLVSLWCQAHIAVWQLALSPISHPPSTFTGISSHKSLAIKRKLEETVGDGEGMRVSWYLKKQHSHVIGMTAPVLCSILTWRLYCCVCSAAEMRCLPIVSQETGLLCCRQHPGGDH